MKTIVCGPPHSGKSVFISNLVRLMPSGAYHRINANGDGEGTWSNNPCQDDVMSVRIKGTNLPEDFENWAELIKSATRDVVLVDIGGRLQDDKIPLFEACDNFVVVSKSEEEMAEWIAFGESCGRKCFATVLSVRDGRSHDEILGTSPYLQTALSGLERGHELTGTNVMRSVAQEIVAASGYNGFVPHIGNDEIDLFEIGRQLGCGHIWHTKSGIPVTSVWFTPDMAKPLCRYLSDNYEKGRHLKIYGTKALWVICLVASCLYDGKSINLELEDDVTENLVAPRIFERSSHYDRNLISVEERPSCTKLSYHVVNNIARSAFSDHKVPDVAADKPIFISGKFPVWFAVSLLLTYYGHDVYLHIPGIGYIKVAGGDEATLGDFADTD
ncbi:MAG: hypothetical protein J5784_00830 [Muribaculaceae bacterium]|nr:hypothetical protein [Muribaculaceae bacterium]